jgi:hypothetical protein
MRDTPTRYWPKYVLAAILALTLGNTVNAGTRVFKCIKDGQTILTDRPCAEDKPADADSPSGDAAPVPSSSALSPIGRWSGEVHYSALENGEPIAAAHSVAVLSVRFSGDGKVVGTSLENGCHILGKWASGPTPTVVWLDMTLDGCHFAGLNRRYHGSFILANPDSSGSVQLQVGEQQRPGQRARTYDIEGTLRR